MELFKPRSYLGANKVNIREKKGLQSVKEEYINYHDYTEGASKYIIKNSDKYNNWKYSSLFGGSNNISMLEKKSNTIVKVEVVDREKVDLEQLRQLGVGILINGNVIQISSFEIAESIDNDSYTK